MSLALAQIWVHPVKSLAGCAVERAVVDDRGLAGDRRFMLIEASGRFVTQREHPRLARVSAEIEGSELVLRAPGIEPLRVSTLVGGPPREVTVWDDRCEAIDAGDEAARWLRAALELDLRLVRMPEATRRPVAAKHARADDLVSFADGFPFLLVTQASLRALSDRLDEPADVRRFRPNLVVAGAEPFEEDAWSELRIGPVRFFVQTACARCQVIDVDPDRGERAPGVLAALAGFRTRDRHAYFGQNLVHEGRGELRVGDAVTLA